MRGNLTLLGACSIPTCLSWPLIGQVPPSYANEAYPMPAQLVGNSEAVSTGNLKLGGESLFTVFPLFTFSFPC